jgi:hypothetical protein
MIGTRTFWHWFHRRVRARGAILQRFEHIDAHMP